MRHARLWISLVAVIFCSFFVLGYYGREIYRQAPPIPGEVVASDGRLLFTGNDIRDGQRLMLFCLKGLATQKTFCSRIKNRLVSFK